MATAARDDDGSSAGARAAARRLTFLYQDGLTLAATLRGMEAIDLLRPESAGLTIQAIRPGLTPGAFAHLRIGLHTLAQAGWLQSPPGSTPDTATLDWTPAGQSALAHRAAYVRLGDYLAHFSGSDAESWSSAWPSELEQEFTALTALAGDRWNLPPSVRDDPHDVVTAHLDGALAIPALLWMKARELLQPSGPAMPPGSFGTALTKLLDILGWLHPDLTWTPHGRESLAYIPHLGLAGSYLPLFARLPRCYADGLESLADAMTDGREWHVQRALNVRASTAAHGRYFADADAIIAALFDRAPIEAQPCFLLDIGCGDGAWLARVAALVVTNTLRGRHLADHPLTLIGADPSPTALERARARLATVAGVDTLFLPGDVADPDTLAAALSRHDLAMADGLHLHAFVDHDRGLRGPTPPRPDATAETPYLDDHGEAAGEAAVEADLAAHFQRWAPHIGRHGMVVLEGHSVAAPVVARHPGALHAVAFEAYHRYSRQYPVERHAFVRALRHAGLRRAATGGRHYPTSRPFVSVSIDHLLPGDSVDLLPGFGGDEPRADSWTPNPTTDLADGRALHALLYEDGDLRYPRRWCAAATGTLVTWAMAAIEARVEQLGQGDVLRVCDYGTGTGLAAIELLKACRERGIEERLARRSAALELHLLDIPSSWFAQGHALLGRCDWVRFHALTDADGRFRPLLDVTQGKQMDIILASMVFHLIRPQALGRLADDLAALATAGGHLIWNAPDLGPPGPWSVLFHDPNRALRARWKQLLSGALPALTPAQQTAIDHAGPIDDARADRRILARAHSGQDVANALSRRFVGSISTQLHEIEEAEVLDTLRVPSNQREFLPEIADPDIRRAVIEELMRGEILPALRTGPAGGSAGHHVHWTFGAYRAREAG